MKITYFSDLKPENILLDSKMNIKIADFGSAKLLDKMEQDNMRRNSFVGTAEFVPPELLDDKMIQTDFGADLWAFGCIFFQMITGKTPFQGKNDYFTFQNILNLTVVYPPDMHENQLSVLKNIFVTNCNAKVRDPTSRKLDIENLTDRLIETSQDNTATFQEQCYLKGFLLKKKKGMLVLKDDNITFLIEKDRTAKFIGHLRELHINYVSPTSLIITKPSSSKEKYIFFGVKTDMWRAFLHFENVAR